jgi:ribose transport system permease protein
MKKDLGLFCFLVCLCLVVMGIQIQRQFQEGRSWAQLETPQLISADNLANTANTIGRFGVFSIGIGIVIITGGIDLSVGSMLALAGVLLSMALTDWHWPWPLAALAVIALPMALGFSHGWLVTRMQLQPFIVTLCGLLIYRGMARWLANDRTKGFVGAAGIETLRGIAKGEVLGVPKPFVILVVTAVIMWFVLHRSVFGRYLYAVGRNEQAARFSGINTRRVITSAYVIAGLLAGISGITEALYTNSILPSVHGSYYELWGIAAAVLGGCSLRGGEGSIIGIVLGTMILQVLLNVVNLLGITSSLEFTVLGTVVLLVVLVDEVLQRLAKRKLMQQRQ